ncbi:RHS repeat-associated core domain-containing protein [Apibacter raozihei]|uniref:RHS repeat-associated core domain-containing protein n=1 Tax=Apibacter raozihei TaxID=2500547 RepID=UPI001E2BF882|nr:RHS repeat-associated core domain-containing protein [Apibacter raozihei]
MDEETGLYYYGARYYNPRESVWLSVDPLTEKYPGTSAYAYVANNPINAIDPDGRDIIVLYGAKNDQSIRLSSVNDIQKLKGISDEYVQSVYQALNAMSTQQDVIKALETSSTVTVRNTDLGSAFFHEDQSLRWNSLLGIEGDSGEILSSASVLVHELNHFNLWDKDEGLPLKIYSGILVGDTGISLSEWEAMKAETKSNKGVQVRDKYEGDSKPIVTKGPLSKVKVKDFELSEEKKIHNERQKRLEDMVKQAIKENSN